MRGRLHPFARAVATVGGVAVLAAAPVGAQVVEPAEEPVLLVSGGGLALQRPTVATATLAAAVGASDHAHHPNHVAVFVGATTPTKKKSETSFTIGADYERRLPGIWGVGVLADFALGDFKRTALVGPVVFLHPTGNLKALVVPAVEFVEKDQDDGQTKHEAHYVMRVGLSYEFHFGVYSVSPIVNVDFIGETKTSIVYGATFGVGF